MDEVIFFDQYTGIYYKKTMMQLMYCLTQLNEKLDAVGMVFYLDLCDILDLKDSYPLKIVLAWVSSSKAQGYFDIEETEIKEKGKVYMIVFKER